MIVPGQDLVVILFVILLAFIILLVMGATSSRKYYVPRGTEIYQDMESPGKVLRSHRWGLTGKPDKIIRKRNRIVVYEFKNTRAEKPRRGHVLQIGAYFLILEETYPQYIVDYGILKYRDHTYRIENSQKLRDDVIRTSDMMRNIASVEGYPVRNHSNPGRCFKCPFKANCSQSLIIA